MFLCDTSLKVSNVFNTLTLKQISGKRKPFSKNWSPVFQLKPLRSKTHHFHPKLLYQKPMLKTNKMATTKLTYHKERSFAINYFIFLEHLLVLEPLKKC